jgi:ABC-type sugar transport system substrate-binding protein
VGFLTDKFDHSARKPFKIAYICNNISWAWNAAISEALQKLGKTLNYEYTPFSANGDHDVYINQITILADQGVQGFICGVDDTLGARVYEVCSELKVAFIAESTPLKDDKGNNRWISVVQDQYKNGAMATQWLIDNYKNYWKDTLDPSKLGLIVLNFSTVSGINEREPGCKDTFLKAFPQAKNNYIVGDLLSLGSAGFSMQGGNDMTAATISAHADIKKWFVVGLVDDWAQGAARAAETLGKTKDVLVSSVQADAFINEMKTGNTGSCYVSACGVSSAEFAVNLALGVVTVLENRATAKTLWPEYQVNGFAQMKVLGTMITKDTYQKFIDGHTVEAFLDAAKK